ncbi:thermopsin family protease [Vulcanisaeta sp. JCM 14467]|uniref:thermopsin family protease n=1 Tax=Vulcanisaeta sp. JCM 14467 TaxID=1295370 RepID=UPI0006D28B48|nr:thermopsin family protease [Vulcanisaeta sp. JCM 14467]
MRAGVGLILTVITASLIIVFTAMPTHAQGVYVSSPPCWWYGQVNESYVILYNYGSETYTIYLMTPSEYQAMSQGSSTYAIGSWVIQPQSSLAIQVPSIGDYLVIVPSTGSCQGKTTLYEIAGQGAPIGGSSFEPASTTEVLGFFNVTSISAYNPNGESQFNVPNSGASLQLNAVLEVQLADGTTQYYWLQDTISFITNSEEYNFVDNVWNYTSTELILSNSTITGNGYVSNSSTGYYYGYSTSFQAYSLPLAGYLLIKLVSVNPLEVSFCYAIIQSGSVYYPPSFDCYDTITIYTPKPVTNAFITSQPNTLTPSNNAIDTEFVFAGYANSEYTTFNSLSAYLALLYRSGDTWKPYGDLFMNGWDTAEAATDLTSSILPNGFIYVTTGSLPSSASTFLTSTMSTPTLPMTYVSIFNPVTGEMWSGYVTTPTSFSFPTVVPGGPGTEYVLTGVYVNGALQSSNVVTITPSSNFASYDVTTSYGTYYLVNVSSPVPVTIKTYNETETTMLFTEWVPSGSTISIYVNSIYTFSNGTRLIYLGSNETETAYSPLSINIPATDFQRQYFVSITSEYPVILNGTRITQFSAWLSLALCLA